jgi:hypothetical protein
LLEPTHRAGAPLSNGTYEWDPRGPSPHKKLDSVAPLLDVHVKPLPMEKEYDRLPLSEHQSVIRCQLA